MAFLANAIKVNSTFRLLHLNGTRVCLRPTLGAAAVSASASIYQTNRLGQASIHVSARHQNLDKLPILEVSEKTSGAILAWSDQLLIQKIFAPYTYSLMYTLDFMSGYMPWWAAIVATTSVIKVVFFPLTISQHRIIARINNILPQTQKFQTEMNEALAAGDQYGAAMAQAKLRMTYNENNLGMFSRIKPALIQAPMFMSMFFLLRGLTGEPTLVESMKTGGAFWFTDLTVPDPLSILPLITCTSLWLLLESGLGAEKAAAAPNIAPMIRWVVRIMPVGLFFFIQNFPAGTLLFWATNNFLSLVTALMFRNKALLRKLNIPDKIKHEADALPMSNKSLKEQFTSAKELGRKSKTTMDLRRLDDLAFRKAGVGPLRKTYKTPPTPQDDR